MTTDRELQERVLKALEFEPGIDVAQVGVTVHDGVVTLRGSVATFYLKSVAERAAGRVYGVRAIANDVEVRPARDMRQGDSAIAEAAANALSWDTAVPSKAVQAAVREGWVTLTGYVDWRYQRNAAEDTVRRLYGVKGVTNLVVLRPHVRTPEPPTRIEGAFTRLAVRP